MAKFCYAKVTWNAESKVGEYVGELGTAEVDDKSEVVSERRGFGCYMMTPSDTFFQSPKLLDSILTRNVTRFMNDPYSPNC